MKYLLLPVHFLKFWYAESLTFFIRVWKNSILFLEEELAVTLHSKLLFVPLFHDTTIVGRVLSFIFRILRIFIGIFAFTAATILIFLIAIYWFFLPIFIILNILAQASVALLLLGVGFFLIHIFTHPHKKVWQVSDSNFWQSSWIKLKDLNMHKLLQHFEVKSLLSYLENKPDNFTQFTISDYQQTGKMAYILAKKCGSTYISAYHFFVSAVINAPDIENYLLKFELKIEDFEQTLMYLEKKKNYWRRVWIWDDDFAIRHLKGTNRGWLGVPTPNLDSVSEDLTKKAARQSLPDFIGNKNVVDEVVHVLSQPGNRNVILVGPAGVGKSTLIKYLAKQIVAGNAPDSLATKRLVEIDLTRLLSGIKTQGELAERVKNVFDEVSFAENIILVVEEIHNLGLGEASSDFNLYSLMLPYLESDKFQFISTTEEFNFSKIIERNSSFARMFTKIELSPSSPQATLEILKDKAILIEWKNKIKVSFIGLKTTVDLAAKLIHDRILPDSALAVLEEAGVYSENGWITSKVIKDVVSRRVNIPIMEVSSADKDKLINLEKNIHEKLIDQEEAVKAISDTLRRSATGLRETNRPIGSFLFVGPTGVGKTELAKTLSEVYFKTRGAFIRFDMSEYQNEESVNRILGQANEPGLLTESVRNNPYALLLLDEFEKADVKILTLFLQVLEDGRLTDSLGHIVDFSNTIIIATSNAASLTIAKGLGEGKTLADIDKQVNDELLQIFKPELINRFDDVILFKPLSQQDLQKVVQLKIAKLQSLLKEDGFLVEFDTSLIEELAKKGFDPVLGARPMRRLIQDTIEAKLSRMILENKLPKGQSINFGSDLLA